MEFEILYEEANLIEGNSKGYWKYKTKAVATNKALRELMNAFYKWAVKEKHGVLPLQITFLDWV